MGFWARPEFACAPCLKYFGGAGRAVYVLRSRPVAPAALLSRHLTSRTRIRAVTRRRKRNVRCCTFGDEQASSPSSNYLGKSPTHSGTASSLLRAFRCVESNVMTFAPQGWMHVA